ncbi:multiprotein bridging factor aMBF1 [Acidianus manzaensis]|uniref:TIGR00270 family protein n=1 Tax=Acidianus manzaensis TaxID=282676 RepID=A0A1W6K078_9CREN|nr:TIGR00270 family protein [Acidianus manzaensis]
MPISGKGITVVYEGSVLTICNTCYSKIKKHAKIYEEKPSPKLNIQKNIPSNNTQKSQEIEIEIVDDYFKIIKEARERMGLSTKQLAEKMKVSENIIKRFEQGKLKPTIDQAKALEKILSIRILITVSQENENSKSSKNFELTLGDIVNFREDKK